MGIGDQRNLHFKYINVIKDMDEGNITSVRIEVRDATEFQIIVGLH